ncbi:hypothetical protein ABL78_5470 [Leptomonas seymouri]|uniref:Uncharacterized protein n=1 Tax=Leptomonas seymouri TaxID=5684 RepID=A0A0N0P517_LEPSE|nr:hypothetical protein ABL78_5470 [Leptomonas seymouri]|eukprot:KPI85477.1 hypothetical protein ABL78_5470 [Leptomonas seymouri]
MHDSVPQSTTQQSSAQGISNGHPLGNGVAIPPGPKVMPPTSAPIRHKPRVTLTPTSRVASVDATYPLVTAKMTSSNPTHNVALLSTPNVEQAAIKQAVNMAYERTAAQLKAIEEKLSLMHEDIKLAAAARVPAPPSSTTTPQKPPAALQVSPNANTKVTGGNALRNGLRCVSPLASAITAAEPGNSAGVNHHLQPIEKPTEPPLVKMVEVAKPLRGGRLAQVTLRTASLRSLAPGPSANSARAEPVKAATALASPPAPAVIAATPTPGERKLPSRQDFSLDESHVVDTPESSSGSDNSDSSDDESNKQDVGSYLPSAAQRSFVKPTKPPTPVIASGFSRVSDGAARKDGVTMRQGIGFKGQTGGNSSSGAGRRIVRTSAGEGERPGAPFASPSSMSTSPGKGNDHSDNLNASGSGQIITVGRQRARLSLDTSLSCTVVSENSKGVDNAKAVDGLTDVTRRQTHAVKHRREHFFAPIPRFSDVLPHTEEGIYDKHDVEKMVLPGAPCSWLCCAALAISFITDVPTTIEKMLRANHMGTHSISLPTVTLSELYDVTNDYIHTRFHRDTLNNDDCTVDEFDEDEDAAMYLDEEELKELRNVHCEMATFDTEVLDPDPEDDVKVTGEHAPITSLAQFRKELMQHLGEEKSMYIFNYEPYVMEQAQLRLRSNMCDTDEEAAAVMQSARYVPKSVGHFGMLLNFDPVKHTATILTPHLSKDQHPLNFPEVGEGSNDDESAAKVRRFESAFANLVLEQQTVSLQVLYESVSLKDPYTSFSRGFVRVFRSAAFPPKVPSIFPLFVLDGSSAGGLMTSVLDVKVAPHVLGLAMLHHLAVTFLLSDNARRKQSSRNLLSKVNVCDVKLRGIPLTKVCQQLRLPLSMIVGASDKSSIPTVFVWYRLFLQQLQINQDIRIGLILPARREDAEDGQPNITDTEFLDHLQLVVKSQSVMLISFNINVGLNVHIDDRSEPAHFAIVIGLDEGRGIVRLADVNVKRFRKTWHVPISRLYNAVMGYGYIVASKDKKVIKALNGKKYQESVLQCAKYFLPPPPPANYQRFEYPAQPYPVTVMADAVERLGFSGTNVERFLNFSGFHISYFLSSDMPLEGAANVIDNYLHYALDDAVSLQTTHYDFYEGNPPPTAEQTKAFAVSGSQPSDYVMRTEDDLLQAIQYVLAEPTKRKLIVNYDLDVVNFDPAVWNGSSGSSFAFVMDYEAATRMVVLSNADPSSFHRTFACPLAVLFSAVCSWDHIIRRARGTILLTTEMSQEWAYENVKGYDMAHALVHHPFKPIFSAACSCLALAATEMMMNIETPTLLGGAPLSFEEDEKRKYKRYNNIFSGEDFLYALPSFSVYDWLTQSVDSQDVESIANNAFAALKLPLRAVDVLKDNEEARKDPLALLDACSGVSGLLTISLVAYDTGVLHGVPGTSVGVVNRVHVSGEDDDEEHSSPIVVPSAPENSVGSVQLLEGDPCRWGARFECPAEVLCRAVVGIYLVREVEEEGESSEN